jgi:uncharacterized protein (TIRG00374 family)
MRQWTALRRNGTWRFWLGLALSGLFLYLAVRQVDWAQTAATLRAADPLLVGLRLALLVAAYGVFAVRWRVLLQPAARVPVRDTFSFIMIGYLANTILPLRLGDLARAVLLGRRHHVSASLVFGTVVLERVLDIVTILGLALVLALVIDVPPVVRAGLTSFAAAALVAVVGLALLAYNEQRLTVLVARLPTWVRGALLVRLVGLVTRFAGGLQVLRDARQAVLVLGLSGLAWALVGVGTVCWVRAFHLTAPWYAGLFVLVVINLGGAIPSSPGAIGVYHYLAVLALSVWEVDKSTALGYAIASHGLNLVVTTLFGLLFLWRENLAMAHLRAVEFAPASPLEADAGDGREKLEA